MCCLNKIFFIYFLSIFSNIICSDDEYIFTYEDLKVDHVRDPHDMLAVSESETHVSQCTPSQSELPCNEEFVEVSKKLANCENELVHLNNSLMVDRKKLISLTKKIGIDYEKFYMRIVHHLWSTLFLEEYITAGLDENEHIIKFLQISISKEDIIALKEYLSQTGKIHKCYLTILKWSDYLRIIQKHLVDDIIHSALSQHFPHLESIMPDFSEWYPRSFEHLRDYNVLLAILFCVFITLIVYLMWLLMRDINRTLNWKNIIMMMVLVIVMISFIWHWNHMIIMAKIKQDAKLLQMGSDISEKCMSKQTNSWNFVYRIYGKIFGNDDECEEYLKSNIDVQNEISPLMALVETLSKSLFIPLQHLGSQLAKFCINFFGELPLVLQVHGFFTIVLLCIVMLFVIWIIYRPSTRYSNEDIKVLLDDMKQQYLRESEQLMCNIARTTDSYARVTGSLQPILLMSRDIIQSQLEHAIAEEISRRYQDFSPSSSKDKVDGFDAIHPRLFPETKSVNKRACKGKAACIEKQKDRMPMRINSNFGCENKDLPRDTFTKTIEKILDFSNASCSKNEQTNTNSSIILDQEKEVTLNSDRRLSVVEDNKKKFLTSVKRNMTL